MKLERPRLLVAAAASDDDFTRVMEQMQSLLPHLRTKSFAAARKRQREADNSASEQESSQSMGLEIDDRLVEDGAATQSRRVLVKREKEEWKNKVISQVRQENKEQRVRAIGLYKSFLHKLLSDLLDDGMMFASIVLQSAPKKQLKQSKLPFKPVAKQTQSPPVGDTEAKA